MTEKQRIELSRYRHEPGVRGKGPFVEALWMLVQGVLTSSFLPLGKLRNKLLTAFGASIGEGVVIKPGVRVKFPWKLAIGDHSWIGENVWIDNLDEVFIGRNCCVSQGVYICTGNHNWSKSTFDLRNEAVVIEDAAWIAARSVLSPGVTVKEGAVVSIGSVAIGEIAAWQIYQGNPAVPVKQRKLKD
ncbi:MAG: WcaF family extracellular polysaccharide biosynthesis acetyltransferase [bacterium]